MTDRSLQVTRGLAIPASELEWRFTTSGGPGGQHANRAATRAEVSFDVERSSVLGPRQRARLLSALGSVVTASAAESRSQARNKDVALDRLRERLAEALRPQRPRVATRPSARAKARRVESKRKQGQRKRLRRPPRGDD